MKLFSRKFVLVVFLVAGCQSIPTCLAGTLVEKQMSVNGVSLPYIEQGKGSPVVFVHGAFSDLRVWEPQREDVVDRFLTNYTKKA